MERELEGHVPEGLEGESLATRLFESGLWDEVVGPLKEHEKVELAFDRRFRSRPAQMVDPMIPARRIVMRRRAGVRQDVHGACSGAACSSTSRG